MNKRIYLFGGTAFSLVIIAISFFAYTERAKDSIVSTPPLVTQKETVAPIPPAPIIPPPTTITEPPIAVSTPKEGARVESPLIITGEARGMWYFEGSFPVELRDASGNTIALGIATSTGEWMTESFAPFHATLSWASTTATSGTLLLKRDNPSGLPQNDGVLSIPVLF